MSEYTELAAKGEVTYNGKGTLEEKYRYASASTLCTTRTTATVKAGVSMCVLAAG
jgi:hypothetical protein